MPSLPRLAAALAALLTPLPAAASELHLSDLNRYSSDRNSREQVISIHQFSDVQPTEWAYQALENLITRYGCVAGYPDGTLGGKQPLSRWEAAALLNACLDRVTEVTDELRRLIKGFESELAVLQGRVDGLDARVGELEATRFSTTTKLSGQATFVVGANSFGGNATTARNNARAEVGATTFNYDLQLSFDTSFSGKDLLRTILRTGNFGASAFGGAGPTGTLSALEVAFEQDAGPDVVVIDKLFYQFPLGGGFTATLGARVGQDDMLALHPSVYPADTVLNLFSVSGAPAAYSKNQGPGAGLWWQGGSWSVSANYVAANGALGDPSQGGLASAGSEGAGTVQVGFAKQGWALAAIYSAIQGGVEVPGTTPFTTAALVDNPASRTSAYGLAGYWQPRRSGWLPSISAGWGLNTTTYEASQTSGSLRTSQSWMVGLQWSDVLHKGNSLGMAVGQPVFATATTGGTSPDDGGYAWEWWYRIQLSDAISVSPALFYFSRPLGQDTPGGESFRQLGALVKTSFRF